MWKKQGTRTGDGKDGLSDGVPGGRRGGRGEKVKVYSQGVPGRDGRRGGGHLGRGEEAVLGRQASLLGI